MKNLIINSSLAILGKIGSLIGTIWAVVGFILYLVKDTPFNWYSIVLIIGSTSLTIISAILLGIESGKKIRKERQFMQSKGYKSKFQMRLEEAMQKQKEL